MKKYVLFIIMILLASLVYGHGEEAHSDFSEALSIIEEKPSCSELTDDQLELLGDYYMEQMHPGEAHVRMDQMMGGEGSESLRDMHINMGYRFYCGSTDFQSHPIALPIYKIGLIALLSIAVIFFGYWLFNKDSGKKGKKK